jgi:FkbM family methyltransferase
VTLKPELQRAIRRHFPSLWLRHAYHRYLTAEYGEPEIHLLPQVVDPSRHAVDVGVYEGIYSRRLAQLCLGVIGFEAHPASAAFCKAALGASAVIHNCALSDQAGAVTLRVPDVGAEWAPSLSTIAPANHLGGVGSRTIQVQAARLDDLPLPPVGFVKIDVEGHEEAVLRGAAETIARNRPALLIEIEERHNPGGLGRLFERFGADGYKVKCVVDGRLSDPPPFEDIVARAPADPDYVNNFFFLPETRC